MTSETQHRWEPKPVWILLIEDNPGDALLVQEALGKEAFNFIIKPRVSDALKLPNSHAIDLILLDLNLPDSRGFPTFQKVYSHFPDTPIIILSGLGNEELAVHTVTNGAQDYIFKENLLNDALVLRTIKYTLGRHKILKELADARKNAEELAKVKTEFLANMSHEIRTPLNGILGMTSLLLKSSMNTEQRSYLETIRSSGELLLALLNDVLDLSKLEAHRMGLELTQFSLSSVVEETLDLFPGMIRSKLILLSCVFESNLPEMVIGDPWRIRQILINLISNAVKFTPQGEVVVRVTKSNTESSAIRFSINDTGVGISPEKQAQLFVPFQQGDSSISRQHGGTGLGLAISKRLVELMKGKIGLESELGKGSQFWFELPFTLPTHQPVRPKLPVIKAVVIGDSNFTTSRIEELLLSENIGTSIRMRLNDFMENPNSVSTDEVVIFNLLHPSKEVVRYFKENLSSLAQKTKQLRTVVISNDSYLLDLAKTFASAVFSPPLKPSLFHKYCYETNSLEEPNSFLSQEKETKDVLVHFPPNTPPVLIVEDNTVNQRIVEEMLKIVGLSSESAHNGKEAVAAFQRGHYSLILMDCQMPEMDGFEATQEIRKLETTSRIPIIALTAHVFPEDIKKCLKAGMDEFIPKPIRIEDLSQKINQFTSQKNEFSIDQLEKLPIYDQTLIDSYRSFSSEGTNDFLRNIINLFLDSTPKLLTQIDGAISTSNETELKHLAHKLKGSVANFGAKRMVMLCEWMERSLNPFHSAKMISRLKKEYEQLQSALSALLTPTVPDKTKPSPPKNQLSV